MKESFEELFDTLDMKQTSELLTGIEEDISDRDLASLQARVNRNAGVIFAPRGKRVLWLLPVAAAAALLVVSALLIPALVQKNAPASDRVEKDGMVFRLNVDGNSYELVDVLPGPETVVTVPEEVDGKPVTDIADGAFLNCSAQVVNIQGSVKNFTAQALNRNESIESVNVAEQNITFANYNAGIVNTTNNALIFGMEEEIPGGIRIISQSAFEGRKALREVVISQGVQLILERAFADCTSLEKATVPASIRYIAPDAFIGCTALKTIEFSGTKEAWDALWLPADSLPCGTEVICLGEPEEIS